MSRSQYVIKCNCAYTDEIQGHLTSDTLMYIHLSRYMVIVWNLNFITLDNFLTCLRLKSFQLHCSLVHFSAIRWLLAVLLGGIIMQGAVMGSPISPIVSNLYKSWKILRREPLNQQNTPLCGGRGMLMISTLNSRKHTLKPSQSTWTVWMRT